MPMKPVQKTESNLLERACEAADLVRSRISEAPDTAVILGTGLGNLVTRIRNGCVIPYSEIPHFAASTTESHAGKLVCGNLAGREVAVMQGRFHFYEGYSLQEITFPVRVMRELGIRKIIITNAAGGLNLSFRKGEIVLIEDHINFMGVNPLVGPNDERCGPRFPDMCEPYSARLAGWVEEAARENKIPLRRGVYLAVTGPCLETKAEYRMMRGFGADLVGMSTVPEAIVAIHGGMEVAGLSVVTDVCDPDCLEPVDIKDVIAVAGASGPKLDQLIEAAVQKF